MWTYKPQCKYGHLQKDNRVGKKKRNNKSFQRKKETKMKKFILFLVCDIKSRNYNRAGQGSATWDWIEPIPYP